MNEDDRNPDRGPGQEDEAGAPPEPAEEQCQEETPGGPEERETPEPPPPPLPRTFARAEDEEADTAEDLTWEREPVDPEAGPPPPPPRSILRDAVNFVRVSMGFRRIPEGVRMDRGLPRLRRLKVGEDPRVIRTIVASVAGLLVFMAVAVGVVSTFGLMAPEPGIVEAASHRALLVDALEKMREGDATGAREVRDHLADRAASDPSLYFLDGYLLVMEGGARESGPPDELLRGSWRRAERVRKLVTLAGFHEATGNMEAALDALGQAADLAPGNPSLQLLAGSAMLAGGRFNDALDAAATIESRHGAHSAVHSLRGLAYLGAGDPARARAEFSAGLLRDPDATVLRLHLASALTQLGEYRKALAELYRARQYLPQNADVYAQLGLLREQTGDLEGARRTYLRAIELEPRHASALNNLAYLLAEKKGAPSEALPYAERAYELAPTVPPVLDTLGWTYHLLGDSARAVSLLEEAARRAPGDDEIRAHLAQARRAAAAPVPTDDPAPDMP